MYFVGRIRTNRLFPNKNFGSIVDFFGVFDDTAKALEFDETSVKQIITNLSELRDINFAKQYFCKLVSLNGQIIRFADNKILLR